MPAVGTGSRWFPKSMGTGKLEWLWISIVLVHQVWSKNLCVFLVQIIQNPKIHCFRMTKEFDRWKFSVCLIPNFFHFCCQHLCFSQLHFCTWPSSQGFSTWRLFLSSPCWICFCGFLAYAGWIRIVCWGSIFIGQISVCQYVLLDVTCIPTSVSWNPTSVGHAEFVECTFYWLRSVLLFALDIYTWRFPDS